MGTPAFQLGWEMAEQRRARREAVQDEERQAQLATIQNAGLTPEQQADAIRTLYANNPSALKRHIENLAGRLVGRKPQPVQPAYAPQSTTTQGAPIQMGDMTLPAPRPVTVSYPGARTQQQRLAQDLSGGRSQAQQNLEAYRAQQDAGQDAQLAGTQKLLAWYQSLPPEQQKAAAPILGIPSRPNWKPFKLTSGEIQYFNVDNPESIPPGASAVGTGLTPKASKPVFKILKGHEVLIDPESQKVIKDFGPTGTARVTRRQEIQYDANGVPHMVTLTSVSTPGGGTIDVDTDPDRVIEGNSKPAPKGPAPRARASSGTVQPNNQLDFRKGTPAGNKARGDYVEAVKLNSLAQQVAQRPNDAVNQKRLAVALERASAGRFTTQALDYIIKAGWGNTIEQWANNPTTGALPADVLRQLVDGAAENLQASKDAMDAVENLGNTSLPAPRANGGKSLADRLNDALGGP